MKRELRLVVYAVLASLGICEIPAADDKPSVEAPSAQKDKASKEKAGEASLKAIADPIQDQIVSFQAETGQKFKDSKFDELEKLATELRAGKETFPNGSWKIYHFYESFTCNRKEPDNVWLLHEQIHKAWIAAKPESVTAKVAYADFLTDYAWRARGGGYANTVTEEGWKLFEERLNAASEILKEATKSPERDPVLGRVFLTVALGQGWPKAVYDTMMEKLRTEEPAFWSYDVARAISLMPRWYGEEGDWEKFAEEAAARPKGLGNEVYARIVMDQRSHYGNIFRESKASWPKTREGLEILRNKYPDSLEIVNATALLAALAKDRKLCKEMFDRLGNSYVVSFWRTPERFSQFRDWADTGVWKK